MKKYLLALALFSLPATMFAYYSDSSDNTVINVILVIWGFLCLVLFFKVWGATNDIDAIAKKMNAICATEAVEAKIRSLYLQSKDAEVIELLNQALADKIEQIYKKSKGTTAKSKTFEEELTKTMSTFAKVYAEFNADIPERFMNLTYDKYHNIVSITGK